VKLYKGNKGEGWALYIGWLSIHWLGWKYRCWPKPWRTEDGKTLFWLRFAFGVER
jgi:hypothetical protein